jgi:histidinol phosphatase-like enzyme (inositol monophosphatase family)
VSGPDLAALLEFAAELAERAGRLALRSYRTELEVERKADDSPVTAADREIERLLRAEVERRFPGDGIIGEEYGMTRAAARRVWMFDPIDGTRTFVRGVPFFGTMIALVEAGEPLLGVIHLPALGETVCAARGEGCLSNGAKAQVSPVGDLDRALIVTTDAERMECAPRAGGWERIRRGAGLCRTWGDCYGYALVATGRAEAMIDPALNVWDAAAIFPIVEEAGGIVTDLEGLRRYDGGHLIATNAALSEALRALLRGADPPG